VGREPDPAGMECSQAAGHRRAGPCHGCKIPRGCGLEFMSFYGKDEPTQKLPTLFCSIAEATLSARGTPRAPAELLAEKLKC
jgi:hypothetical protein